MLAGHEGSQRIADQIKCLKTKRERWPEKIIQTWLKRIIPVFSSEAVTKLIQAYCSMVEEVNESRKRQKESLRADINQKKKQLDDIATKRGKTEDIYQSVLLACRGELRLHQPHSFEYAQLEAKIRSAHESYQFTMQRLLQNEIILRLDLTTIERNFHPIRLLSTQSNQKNQIINKQKLFWVGYHMRILIS